MKNKYDYKKILVFMGLFVLPIYFYISSSCLSSNFWYLSYDRFMDFFNSVRDACSGVTYTERKVIYPPMINLFYRCLGKYMEQDYTHSDFDSRLNAYVYPNVMVIFMFYNVVLIALLTLVLYKSLRISDKYRYLIIGFILLSNPMLYAFERGNSILICLVLILLYLLLSDSQNKFMQELALIFLACAINIKIYPVFIALILLSNKELKKCIRTAVYSVILFLAGFIFYGGIEGVKTYFSNIFGYSNATYNPSIIGKSDIKSYMDTLQFISPLVKNIVVIALFLSALAIIFVAREQWQKWLACCWIMLNIPGVSLYYNWIFFIIPYFMFFNDRFSKEYEKIFAFLITSIFIFYPYNFNTFKDYGFPCSINLAGSCVLSGIIGIFMLVLLLDNSFRIFKQYKNRQKEAQTE